MDADDSLYFLPDGIVDEDDNVGFGSSHTSDFADVNLQDRSSQPQLYCEFIRHRSEGGSLVSSREEPYDSSVFSWQDTSPRGSELKYPRQLRHSPTDTRSPNIPLSFSSSYSFRPSADDLPQSLASSPAFHPPVFQPFYPSVDAPVFTPATAASTITTSTFTPTLPPPSRSALTPSSSPNKKPLRSGGKPSPRKPKMSPQKRSGAIDLSEPKVVEIAKRGSLDSLFSRSSLSHVPSSFTLPRAASSSPLKSSFPPLSSSSASLSANSNSFPIRAALASFDSHSSSDSFVSCLSSLSASAPSFSPSLASFSSVVAASASSESSLSRRGRAEGSGSVDLLSVRPRSYSAASQDSLTSPSPSLPSRTLPDSPLPPYRSSSASPHSSPLPPHRRHGSFPQEQKSKSSREVPRNSSSEFPKSRKILPPLPLPPKKKKVPGLPPANIPSPVSNATSSTPSLPSLSSSPLTSLLLPHSSSSAVSSPSRSSTSGVTTPETFSTSSLVSKDELKGSKKANEGRGRRSSDRGDSNASGRSKHTNAEQLPAPFQRVSSAPSVCATRTSPPENSSAPHINKSLDWSTTGICSFLWVLLVGCWRLLLVALGQSLRTLEWGVHVAALTVTEDHHLTFCFFYLTAPFLWYAFLFQIICAPGSPAQILKMVTPMMFLTQGIFRNSILLDLTGFERVLVAFILTSFQTRQHYRHVEFLLVISLGLLASLSLGTSVLIQWGIFTAVLVANHRGVKNLSQ